MGYCFDERKEPSGMLLKHRKGSLQEVQPQFRVRTSIIRSAHTPQSRLRILPPRGQVRPCGAEPMLSPCQQRRAARHLQLASRGRWNQ